MRACTLILPLCLAVAAASPPAQDPRATVAERVLTLNRTTVWTPVATVPVGFPTFHPQGMVKIGATYFVSSVEVRRATTRYATPVDGYDRDTGEGVGHLFAIDASGRLLHDLTFPAGDIYHPGGIDYDGRYIWVPLTEYRPNSRSVIYRVDPAAMTFNEVLRYPDSIGAIVHNTDDNTLHGANWGSRRFYRWTIDGSGRATNPSVPPARLGTDNPSHYVDYQDCKYLGARRMLCAGVSDLPQPGGRPFRLGGLDLVSLADGRPLHQIPMALWTPDGTVMPRNPFWIEPSAAGLRLFFMPEDDRSTIYIFETVVR